MRRLERRPVAVAPESVAGPDAAVARHGVLPTRPERPDAPGEAAAAGELTLDDAQRRQLHRLAKEWGSPP